GYLSLVYDSAGEPRPDDDPSAVPPRESYSPVNQWALMPFDWALAYASAGLSSPPSGWPTRPGGAAASGAAVLRPVRSFQARMAGGVARDPAERAAVDWNAVIDDATNGIQADFNIAYDPSNGWDHAWMATTLHFRDANWHQMTYYIIGMADTTGAFDAWLAT